jgi:hypothetical protein
LTEFICGEVLALGSTASPQAGKTQPTDEDEVDALSQEELESSLLSELKRAGY